MPNKIECSCSLQNSSNQSPLETALDNKNSIILILFNVWFDNTIIEKLYTYFFLKAKHTRNLSTSQEYLLIQVGLESDR